MKIVLLLLMSVLFFSCTEPQPENIISEYKYINESGVDIKILIFDTYIDSLVIKDGHNIVKKHEAKGVIGAAPFFCDSLKVIYNLQKSLIYKWTDTSNRNPLLLESYTKAKYSEYHYEFKYIFTKQDYLNLTE